MDHLELKLENDLGNVPCAEGSKYDTNFEFHDFPESVGWKVNDRHGCEILNPDQHRDFIPFLQAWLFFGLLHTVLAASDSSINVHKEFTASTKYISTKRLGWHLEKWQQYEKEQWEKSEHNQEIRRSYSIRMVQVQMALDRARGVVRRYCSLEGSSPTLDEYIFEGGGDDKTLFDAISLSLVVLGETLSNAKATIVEQIGFRISGWHGDAMQGWGTHKLIKEKMEKDWCARTLHVMEGHFRGNTTGLLAAYSLGLFQHGEHSGCTSDRCEQREVEDKAKYERKHTNECWKTRGSHESHEIHDCGWDGPDPEHLRKKINDGAIPLFILKKDGATSKLSIELTDNFRHKNYATISHVWSDGYGNPAKNELRQCQLKFLENALDNVEKGRDESGELVFWMDTLAIPVGEEYLKEREIAIGRIHETFVRSRYTLVIDRGLCGLWKGTRYHEIALNILASGWMRRLWTLQEAYLSERMFFKFRDKEALDLEDLERMYLSGSGTLNSCIPTIARSYFHSLLGTARKARIHDMTPKEGLSLIGSVWKATQWRTTTRKEHEVLALATLFDLNTDRSSDARALNQAFTARERRKDYQNEEGNDEEDALLERNMCTLLELLENVYPGSIPAGIIFVPGEKLPKKGFRWAPRTWMSGYAVDYPDPLALNTPTATLVPGKGLYVRFPGILLHSMPGTSPIIEMRRGGAIPLRFPVDSTLTEWYEVRYADGTELLNNSAIIGDASSKEYAIILSRHRPREVEEIALMVEIGKSLIQRSFESNRETRIFDASIEFRIWIKKITHKIEADVRRYYGNSRQMGGNQAQQTQAVNDNAYGKSTGKIWGKQIFGEMLDLDQKWCVDKENPPDVPYEDPLPEPSNPGGNRQTNLDLNSQMGSGGLRKIVESSDETREDKGTGIFGLARRISGLSGK